MIAPVAVAAVVLALVCIDNTGGISLRHNSCGGGDGLSNIPAKQGLFFT